MASGGGWTHLATHTPSPTSLSPPLLAPIPSLRPMSGPGNGPKALCLVLIKWEVTQRKTHQLVVLGGVSNSDHF
jgi:hypothetical protein